MGFWRLLGICAIAALWLGTASAQPTADVRIVEPLALERFTEVRLDAGPQGGVCEDTGGLAGSLDPASDAPLLHVEGQGPDARLHFEEGEAQHACAEARFGVSVPADARAMAIAFSFHRHVNLTEPLSPSGAAQWIALYAHGGGGQSIDDPGLPAFACMPYVEYVDPSIIDMPASSDALIEVPLEGCGMLPARLVVAFGFGDFAAPDRVRGVPEGQAFSAQIQSPQVTFAGMSLDILVEDHDGLDPESDIVGFTTVTIDVPEDRAKGAEITFSISNDHGIQTFYKSRGGLSPADLDEIPASSIRSQEDGGLLYFTLSPALIEQWGSGRYIVLFDGPDTGQVSFYRLPVAALALLAPLAAGVLAQRNLNHLHRSARGRLPGLRRRLQLLLAAAWGLYILVAFILLVTDAGVGMAAWPPRPENALAYLALVISTVAMVIAGVVARRKEMAVVFNDLSELERIQRELERSNKELEQFAYVASHDLKEPLRMVAGYTQLLEMRYGKKLDGQGREFLDFAAEGAQRLQRMVDDLLAYSRVRTDQARLRPVDLNEVVAIVRGHLRKLLDDRDVRFVADDLPTVQGDQGQLVQLILNLVQNAIKFSPQASPLVEIMATSDVEGTTLHVRDEGIGIEPKQQARIFDIFQRLHLREEYEGNGIGLAMCKKIVEQAGGRIEVTSRPGAGATFHVFLPEALTATPRRLPVAAPSGA